MSDHLTPTPHHSESELRRVLTFARPDKKLLIYYLFASFLAGPFFLLPLIPLYFRYHTLHYRFDEQGVQMRWGILFRREINLAYARIQDIHLTSNLLERWLGLARIQVQTASANAGAEMTIEGLLEFELVRDFLYGKMRGVHAPTSPHGQAAVHSDDAVVAALAQVSADLRAVRAALERRHV